MNSLTTSPSYVPRVCYFPASLDCTKWERVGATIRPDQIHVGAVNCAKHGSLCRSLKVHGYPSLVAVNWPGAPQGTPEQPSVNLFKFGTHSFEDTMTNIEAAFPGVMGVPRELEGNFDYGMEAGKVGGGEGGARVVPCVLRMEDAAVSVRWVLRNDVFTQGLTLSDERMGE